MSTCAARWRANALSARRHPGEGRGELLERMLAKVDGLCTERDRQVKEQRVKYPDTDKAIKGLIERRFR